MAEVSVTVLDVEEENALNVFYNIETAKIDYFHIDVIDGEFAENENVLKMRDYTLKIHSISMTPIEVHLMVKRPMEHIDDFIDLGADRIMFHIESCKDNNEALDIIKYIISNGIKAGITINPDTEVEKIYELLPFVHMVLVMSVIPGKGGQKFIESTLSKISKLKQYCYENDLDIDIEVDGGITDITGKEAVDSGANILVSGSYILNAIDYKEAINKLKEI
jgi:ribulose-phosphate 3-epimerase